MQISKRDPPKGIALSKVLLALAGLARAQRAFKLARYAYSKLQGLVLPPAVTADVELASLMLRACPFTDDDELLPICYRCQATNTLLNTQVRQVGSCTGGWLSTAYRGATLGWLTSPHACGGCSCPRCQGSQQQHQWCPLWCAHCS